MPFQSADGKISKLAYDKSVEALDKANNNFSKIDVLSGNPINPAPGQMWIVDEIYESLFIYTMSGIPDEVLDTNKVDVIIRNEVGSNYDAAKTYAKIDQTGENADVRYAQSVNDGTRGDINIFPIINDLDFDNYKYRFTFDMTLTSSVDITEALGFSLQTPDTVAQIAKNDYIHVNTVYNDASSHYLFVDKKEAGTNTRLLQTVLPDSNYPGLSTVEVELEKSNISVSLNSVEIGSYPFTVGASYFDSMKPSLYVQNKLTTTSTTNRFSNLEIERLPR